MFALKAKAFELISQEAEKHCELVDLNHVFLYSDSELDYISAPIAHENRSILDEYNNVILKEGLEIPIDMVILQEKRDCYRPTTYIMKAKVESQNLFKVILEQVKTKIPLDYEIIFDGKSGQVVSKGSTATRAELDLILNSDPKIWCGRVRTGRGGRRYQFCGGSDCPNGGVCIKWDPVLF